MCGIAVIAGDHLAPHDSGIERMVAQLHHRGPDAQTHVKLPGCHLGHTRLAIIDLAGGAQPMPDAHERYWISFNGEIFNFRELRVDLEARGHRFITRSDTEVLLHAWQEFGEDTPRRLNGQFAFAVWDARERLLFAARDRMGEKPLYWAQGADGTLVLASQIASIVAADRVAPRLDTAAVEAYLGLLYVPPDRTIYDNVHTLRPGHALTWRAGKVCQRAYWQPRYSTAPTDPREAVEETRRLVEQAVSRQMVADVPVGAFLSGGLDSSTIVALMSRSTSHAVQTFSVGFGDLINELPYARVVADRYETDHHELQMSIPVGDMLETMAAVYDEPLADSSNIPTYLVAEFARRSVKVALSGDGGDELFGGYAWYQWLLTPKTIGPADELRTRLGSLAWHALARVQPRFSAAATAAGWAHHRTALARRLPDPLDRHLSVSTELRADRSVLWGGHPPAGTDGVSWLAADSTAAGMDRAVDFDVRSYLPGDILVKVDRAAMAHGLETRAPFLDVDLVEFVLSLRADVRFRGEQLKWLLRESCRDLWPAELANRPKQGFGAPLRAWIARPDVQDRLARVMAPSSPLLAVLPGAKKALPTLSAQQTWTLLCLGLWLERRPECLSHS